MNLFSFKKFMRTIIFFTIIKWKRALTQSAEDDINIAPAQDSPKNINNILNDDCIQAILSKLKHAKDFLNAAEVCIRFQENAQLCFPFKRISFGKSNYRHTILFESTEKFVRIFYSRIKCINCKFHVGSTHRDHKLYQESLDLISYYCGNTLTELNIMSHASNSILTFRLPLPALNKLQLNNVHFLNFNPTLIFPTLKSLQLLFCYETESLKWLENEFSKLEHVEFKFSRLTIEMFTEFKNRNTQLQIKEEKILGNKPYFVIMDSIPCANKLGRSSKLEIFGCNSSEN